MVPIPADNATAKMLVNPVADLYTQFGARRGIYVPQLASVYTSFTKKSKQMNTIGCKTVRIALLSCLIIEAGRVTVTAQLRSPLTTRLGGRSTPGELGSNHSSQCAISLAMSAEEQRIFRVLNEPNRLGPYVRAPMASLSDDIRKVYGVNCEIDERSLEAVGLSSTELFVSSPDLRGCLAGYLARLLGPIDLRVSVAHDTLKITTPEEASCELMVVVYDVTNLVLPNGHFDTLINVVVDVVEPDSWEENGVGGGKITSLEVGERRLLVVRQDPQVHQLLQQTLETLANLAESPLRQNGHNIAMSHAMRSNSIRSSVEHLRSPSLPRMGMVTEKSTRPEKPKRTRKYVTTGSAVGF